MMLGSSMSKHLKLTVKLLPKYSNLHNHNNSDDRQMDGQTDRRLAIAIVHPD